MTEYTTQPDLLSILNLIDYLAAKKIASIQLLGGEPLLRNDLEIIGKRISDYGIASVVASNGILATKKRADELFDSGLKNFQISLEGFNEETNDKIRGQGTFRKIVTGIHNLKKSGAYVRIGFTLTSQNSEHIDSMIQLGTYLEVDEVRFQGFVPIGTGAKNQLAGLSQKTSENIKKNLDSAIKLNPKLKIVSPFLKSKCIKSENCGGCGAGTTNCIINSDMTLSACDLLTETDRSISKIKSPEDFDRIWFQESLFSKWRGEFENQKDHPFQNVLNSPCITSEHIYGEKVF